MTETKAKIFKKDGKQRLGKGFSTEELKKAGLSPKEARRLHIPTDSRRKTTHNENIETVKSFLKNRKPKPKLKRKKKSKSPKPRI